MEEFCCRSCSGRNGMVVLNLGLQPLANSLLTPDDLGKPEPKFPLCVAVCRQCWLMQITHLVPAVRLFSHYHYFSSISDSMLQHAEKAAKDYISAFQLGSESLVVEIASNDGYLLKNFVCAAVPCLGIEPAANIAAVAQQRGVDTLCEFFSSTVANRLSAMGKKADLILGNNVFAHVPDINDFIQGLKKLLKARGRVILEFPYACELIEKIEFDTIYHEHVFYFTLTALRPLFQRHDLEIIKVERLAIHGGSLRLTVTHPETERVDSSVGVLVSEETSKGVGSEGYYESFGRRVRGVRDVLLRRVLELRSAGKSVAAYGASAKGSTLLNYYGLDASTISFVADRSPHKQGRFTPGTHIPIVPADELERRRPDYALLLAWNFADEILTQQRAYRAAGGRFIVPIPEVSEI